MTQRQRALGSLLVLWLLLLVVAGLLGGIGTPEVVAWWVGVTVLLVLALTWGRRG